MIATSAPIADAGATAGSESRQLRRACDEFVGMIMFGQLLRQARDSSLNSDLFANNGAKLFQSQMDDLVLQRASRGEGRASMFGGLGDALYRGLGGDAIERREQQLDING